MLEGWNNETVLHENRSYFCFTVALLLRQNILPVPSRRCHMNFRRDVRPRTITKELGTRQLIFIGVMTAEKFLDTRAKAVYGTWGKTVPGKLEFFSSSSSQTRLELPVVSLQGVDDSYPPQRKSMKVLREFYFADWRFWGVLRHLIFAIWKDRYFLLGINFCDSSKSCI